MELGRRLAGELPPRGVVLLIGNLGAGKTTLAKGIVSGLGAAHADEVSSPTFTLIHEYGEGRAYHIDLYRLEEARQVFDKARKDGAHESRQAYMADALVEMAKASGSETGTDGTTRSATTKTLVRIRVDLDALMRGYAEAGETCEIPGVGRVSVAIARAVLGDALLELVITNGIDVSTVITDSRYIRKALNLALEERDPTCVVPGCNATDFLERDHWRKDFAKKGKTAIYNLCRICVFHHRQRTHGGWVLSGGPGNWSQ